MNVPPILPVTPPDPAAEDSLTYELTRWDVFINSMTVMFRNRVVQGVLLVAFVVNGAIILLPQVGKVSIFYLVVVAVGMFIGITLTILFFQGLASLAIAYVMKQKGVVGKHTLLVTGTGLIERTDFNETLHKWPSIIRIVSLFGSVYIYVGDQNSHQVPRHSVNPQALESFLAKLRSHCPQLK